MRPAPSAPPTRTGTSAAPSPSATRLRYSWGLEVAQLRHGLVDTIDRDDFQLVDLLLRQVGARNDGALESELGDFLQAFLTARRGPHLARQPDLAEHGDLVGNGTVGQRR